jgi:hypothetical protein
MKVVEIVSGVVFSVHVQQKKEKKLKKKILYRVTGYKEHEKYSFMSSHEI